jgi:cell division protein ZapA (FtsZ GTPase activity inhibitor)
MSKNELKSTTVIIGGRSYPVKVEESRISLVQSASKRINEQVRFFQSTYKDRDLQDCLSMTLLTIAMEVEELSSNGQVSDLQEQLEKIDHLLQSALS